MKKKMLIKTVIAFVIVFSACIAVGMTVIANVDTDRICKGVYIEDINVGGMTKSEAEEAVAAYIDDLKSKKLTINVDEKKVDSTLEELGFECLENNHVEDAMNVGKSGNLIKRYKELKNIEKDKLVYKLKFSLDKDKVEDMVKKCSEFDIAAVNASMKRENGSFVISEEKTGRKVIADETISKIEYSIGDEWDKNDIILDAVVIDDVPEYKKVELEKCTDNLGEYSTSYASSSNNRVKNISNGADLINGTILYPGEVFSAYEKLQPFTAGNGYFEAGAYVSGKLVDDNIGGGICQVSSTLYNAVLNAELEIVERSPHSMSVSYVPLSRDAAIAGTYKDFKFKNNYSFPIYVEAYTSGRTIYFKIWGQETRDISNRKISFESVTVETIAPPKDVVTEDKTKPIGYKHVEQSAHTGYKAELYKIVYENGEQVSRTRINSSSYNAAPRYLTIGTKEEKTDDKEKEDETDSKKDTDKKPSKADNKTEDNESVTEPTNPSSEEPSGEETPKEDNMKGQESE